MRRLSKEQRDKIDTRSKAISMTGGTTVVVDQEVLDILISAHDDAVKMDWRSREDYDGKIFDGDRFLVAVEMHKDSGGGFEFHTVTIACDEDYFEVRDMNGDSWCWDWDDVSYLIQLGSLSAALAAHSASAGGKEE